MSRALSSLIVLFAVILAGEAEAGKKDKIAILGLEVLGTTTVDSESTRVAQDLTVALRTRPKAGKGPYQWTPGSEKELVDEKIMNNCPNEDKDCMAKIGAALGADFLVYGKIERKQLGGQAGYQISLKLLKVGDGKPGSAQSMPGWTEFIPLAESSGTKLQEWARQGYKKLTNDFDGGTLKIRIRNEGFDRGTILVEGEERGNITAGSGEVPSLPEGRYKISIVAGGFERWDSNEKVTIRNGETTTEEISLTASKTVVTPGCDPAVSKDCGGTVSQAGSGRGLWRAMFVVGAVMTAGGGGLLFVASGKVSDAKDANSCVNDVECLMGKGFNTPDDRNDSGKKFETLSYVAGGVLAVGGTLMVVGLIKGFVVSANKEGRVSSKVQRRGTEMVVTPVITDRSAGATLRLSW